jgi:hypothetical protein
VRRDGRTRGTPALLSSALALALAAAPSMARATGPGAPAPDVKAKPTATANTAPAGAAPATKAEPAETPAPVVTVPGASAAPPTDAEAALERARAAYEYGEMEMVVDSARLVAEGRLHPTPAQRAQALRYLGIGLYLTGRQEGAETAFFDLLRLRPHTRLDPTNARPDVVAFFENVRRRHAAEINEAASNRPGKSLALAFLPPLGQFQAGHTARGITIAALEVLTLGTAITTDAILKSWDVYPGHTFMPMPGQPGTNHHSDAQTLKVINNVSVALFAATVVIGIVDGVASYVAVEPEDEGKSSIADIFLGGYRF